MKFSNNRTFGGVQKVINSTYIIVTIPSEKENKQLEIRFIRTDKSILLWEKNCKKENK